MGGKFERGTESPPTMSINAIGTGCSFGAQGSMSNGRSSDLVKYDPGGSAFPSDSIAGETGWAWECLDLRMSRTDFAHGPHDQLCHPLSEHLPCPAPRVTVKQHLFFHGTSVCRIGEALQLSFLEGMNLGKRDC